jgi:hypothetical protein
MHLSTAAPQPINKIKRAHRISRWYFLKKHATRYKIIVIDNLFFKKERKNNERSSKKAGYIMCTCV